MKHQCKKRDFLCKILNLVTQSPSGRRTNQAMSTQYKDNSVLTLGAQMKDKYMQFKRCINATSCSNLTSLSLVATRQWAKGKRTNHFGLYHQHHCNICATKQFLKQVLKMWKMQNRPHPHSYPPPLLSVWCKLAEVSAAREQNKVFANIWGSRPPLPSSLQHVCN